MVLGLILAYGIIVIIGGTVDLAGASNGIENAPDIGGSDGVFPPIVLLLAQLTVTLFGLVSTFLGFQVCVCVCGCVFCGCVFCFLSCIGAVDRGRPWFDDTKYPVR